MVPLLNSLGAAWWAHKGDSSSSLGASAVHTALPSRMESLVQCLLDFFFFFFAKPRGLPDLSSLTRD